MESAARVAGIQVVQNALRVITALQLTAYMWPPQAQVHDGASFDFIVVGAGTAGSVIANRLTEDPNIELLLIEAGGDPPLEADLPGLTLLMKRTRSDWNYTSENNKYLEECHQYPYFEMTLGKVLGGTSSSNFMIYGRGNPHGYENWAAVAKDDTWKWENVLPYFIKAERVEDPEILNSPDEVLYGTKGYLGIEKHPTDASKYLEAFKELGHFIGDVVGNGSLGFSNLLLTTSQGSRTGSARSYLSPIKNRPNLHLLKNTLATKILFDEDKNAVGVNIITEDGRMLNLKATKEVIVSAGAFNSPKLLMLSGIGPKSHLESKNIDVISDLPVGENLIDYVTATIFLDTEKLEPSPPRDPHEYPATKGITGYVALNKSQEYPDYQVIDYITEVNSGTLFCAYYFRYKHEICSNFYKYGVGRTQLHVPIINLNPKSRGRVLLRSTSPADPPLIYTEYFSEEEDLENLIDYIQDYAAVVNTTFYKSVKTEILDPLNGKCSHFGQGSREYWRCYTTCMVSGMSSYTGTCAMGTVVDSKLRVHGVQRLRVADGSVIPTPNGGSPYGQVIMIGEKVADFIKKDHQLTS